jgi:hypothetical protein
MRVFLMIGLLTIAAPAFAETGSPAGKTDFTKPFIYDGLRQQLPPSHVDRPSVDLTAGSDKPYVYDSARKQLPPSKPGK